MGTKKIDLQSFIDWQAQDIRNRRVSIKIDIEPGSSLSSLADAPKQMVQIYVYDYRLSAGQFVERVEDIDLVNRISFAGINIRREKGE